MALSPRFADPSPAEVLGDLVPAAAQGDDGAGHELLRRVHTLALRYARARLGTYPAAEHLCDDVAQEVCVAVLAALPRYEERGVPFEAFVYGIASRKVADAQRAHARGPLPAEPAESSVFDGPVDGPEQQILVQDEATRAWSMLERLPERQREVLVLRVGVGLDAQETAQALGISAVAVRVTQMRALRELRRRWAEVHA